MHRARARVLRRLASALRPLRCASPVAAPRTAMSGQCGTIVRCVGAVPHSVSESGVAWRLVCGPDGPPTRAGSLRLVRYRSVDGGFRWRGFPFRSRHITLNIYLFRVSCVRVCPLPTRSTPCQLVSHDTHSQCACRSPPRPRRRAGPSASRVDVLYGTLALSVPNRCVTVSCQARSVCVHLLCGGISGVQSNTIIFVSFFAASIEFARRARSTAAALGS